METVDVVFSGTVLSGFDPREAATTLAAMTGMSQDEALALLSSGKPQLARRGLSPEEAQTLTEQFAAMGVAAFVWTAEGKEGAAPEKLSLAKPASTVSPDKYLLDEDDEDFNPYTAPPADLSQTETPKKKGGHWRETCVVVPARQGGQWIEDARAMVKSATGVWIGAILLFWIGAAILSGVLSSVLVILNALTGGFGLSLEESELAEAIVVSLLSSLLSGLAGSFLAGGLALLAHRQTEQEAFEATDVFAVFQTCPGRMLQLAALELAYSFFACVFLGFFLALLPRMETTATVLFVFLDFLLFLPLIPVLLCAPTLVAVAGQRPFQAIKQSFLCTCKNWRPVLVNSLILGAVPGLTLLGSFSFLATSMEGGAAMVFFVLACLLFGLLCLSLSICLPAFILLPAMMMALPVFVLWMEVMMDGNTAVIFCVLACLFILLSLLYLPAFILLPAMSYRAVREMFYEEGKEEVSDATRVSCARKERMETVDVVFSGTVLPGFDPREAAASLAKMTGMSQDEALALLSSSKPRLARRGLSPEAAQALTEKFAVMGVVAFVRTPGDAASSPSAPTAPEKAVPSPEGSESIPLAKPEPSLSTSALSLNKDLLDEDDEDFNPYTAPPADLSQTGPPKKKGGHWRETCVVVPAARGIQWIKESWAMFKSAPVTWLGALLLSWFCMSMLGMLVLPLGFLGILAFLLCVPFFAGGLALLAHRQTEHEVFGAFDVFAAFYVCPNNMLFLGILGFACSILAGPFFRVAFSLVTGLGGGAMGRLAIFLPLIAALYMASTLVAVGGLYPPQSIWQGFLATCKNWRPMLFSALILGCIPGSLALLIGLIHPLVTGKGAQEAATFLATIQAFLIAILVVVSLLILLVMPAIVYRAVRDMFYEEGKEGS